MKATEHLTVMSSLAWNRSSQQTAPTLAGNGGVPVSFPTSGLGSTLAQSPPFQGNIRIRYDVPFEQYARYWQVAAQHSARTLGLRLAYKF